MTPRVVELYYTVLVSGNADVHVDGFTFYNCGNVGVFVDGTGTEPSTVKTKSLLWEELLCCSIAGAVSE